MNVPSTCLEAAQKLSSLRRTFESVEENHHWRRFLALGKKSPGNTLPETNSSHLKMDGWNITSLLGWPIFRGYVSFREGKSFFCKDPLLVFTFHCSSDMDFYPRHMTYQGFLEPVKDIPDI